MSATAGVRIFRSTTTPVPAMRSKGVPDRPYAPTPVTGGGALSGLWASVPAPPPGGGGSGIPSAGGLVDPLTINPWTWPSDATWPALPSQKTLRFVDYYQAGDSLRTTLSRVQSALTALGTGVAGYAQVQFPDGYDGEFADFAMSSYGLLYGRILGFIGSHPDQVRIRLAPLSSTLAGTGGTCLRLADGRNTEPLGLVPLNYGFTLEGTDQPPQAYPQDGETGPQLYSGFMQYYGRGAINQKVRIRGASQGNHNSPPGETFATNSYHTTDCVWRGCEVTGFNAQGRRSGGSPFGGNNSVRDVIEDCYFHDSYVSSLTWSFAGSSSSMSAASTDPTTRRTRIEWNANHSTASGKGFGAINHENVMGAIFHYNPVMFVGDRPGVDDAWLGHIAFANALVDNTNIKIINPVWNALHPSTNGMLYLKISKNYPTPTTTLNAQVTIPTVKLGANPDGTGGTTLTPIIHTQPGPKAVAYTESPSTHFIVNVS